MHRAGFVNIVGNPNVGKSTLSNRLVGERLSIITSKAQTTRHRIMGIVNTDDYQIVFSDTPGVLKPKFRLQQSMLEYSTGALVDADVLLYVTDVIESPTKNQDFLDKVAKEKIPILLVINKIDLLKGNIIKKMSDKKQVVLIRIFIVVFIAISAFIAIYQTQSKNESVKFIAQLMGVSWGALAGAFLAPFLYGLYWKKTTKLAGWVSFIFGAGVMVLNLFFRSFFPVILQSPINCGAFTMIAGLIIVPLVSLISPKPDKQLVDDAFACYEKRVPAAQKRSLD